METLIDVFRMTELSVQTRIKVIKQLGEAINWKYARNITEPIVEELVKALEVTASKEVEKIERLCKDCGSLLTDKCTERCRNMLADDWTPIAKRGE